MQRRTLLKWAGSGAASAGIGQQVLAQAPDYPNRQVRIIAASAPGSATDIAARVVADLLAAKYKQTYVVENRSGAGGVIGMQAVAASRADGYTLQLGGLGHNVIPAVTLRGLPLDIPAAIVPVAQVGEFYNTLVVRTDHPANSAKELQTFLQGLKQAPTFTSNGIGSSSHLTGALFSQRVGVKMTHVPFRGAGEALIAVASGDADFSFMNIPPVLPLLQAGKLKALAVTSPGRARQIPNVPTMLEAGVDGFDVTSWLGLYAPAGTPAPILRQIAADVVAGLASPATQKRLLDAGVEPKAGNVDEFTDWNRRELARWKDVAVTNGIVSDYGQ